MKTDLLTALNGQAITYDQIGNPLTYRDNMSFEWSGRQLSAVQTGEGVVSYTYNSSGIRTSKTINGITTSYQLDECKIVSETTEGTTKWYIYDEADTIVGFEYADKTYYFEKNIQGDVVRIFDEQGMVVSEYIYDAWGNIIAIAGDERVAEENPFRYRGYYYDNETGFYYLLARYYDSHTRRFLKADSCVSLNCSNLFAYAGNNPVTNSDSSGNVVETVLDVGSAVFSLFQLITTPSWANAGFLVWDVASILVPCVPGSYAGKAAVKVASKADDFKDMSCMTVGTYTKIKNLFKGTSNIEVHHIIEKRFLAITKNGRKVFGPLQANKMLSIPLSKSLHKTITQRWRKRFKYGYDYGTISKKEMRAAIKYVYADMPELKHLALKYLNEVWK